MHAELYVNLALVYVADADCLDLPSGASLKMHQQLRTQHHCELSWITHSKVTSNMAVSNFKAEWPGDHLLAILPPHIAVIACGDELAIDSAALHWSLAICQRQGNVL